MWWTFRDSIIGDSYCCDFKCLILKGNAACSRRLSFLSSGTVLRMDMETVAFLLLLSSVICSGILEHAGIELAFRDTDCNMM